MKKAKKTILMLLCAVLLVTASVTGTMAYLSADDSVENTFTIGNVTIDLKEYDVYPETGKKNPASTTDTGLTDIKLVPGRTIEKNPFVTVTGGSEKCWLFVKVENGLAAFEDKDATIESQILKEDADGNAVWTKLEGAAGVYYKVVDADDENQVFDVFTSVTIADNANEGTNKEAWNAIDSGDKITVTAYAIQYEGFDAADKTELENAEAAWKALTS